MKKLNNLIVHCASSIVHQSKTLTLLLVMLMSVNMAWGADAISATIYFGSGSSVSPTPIALSNNKTFTDGNKLSWTCTTDAEGLSQNGGTSPHSQFGSKSYNVSYAQIVFTADKDYVVSAFKAQVGSSLSSPTLKFTIGSNVVSKSITSSKTVHDMGATSSNTYNLKKGETMSIWVGVNSAAKKNIQIGYIQYTMTEAAAPAFEITAQSNNTTYGTVELDGSTITASPKSGYRVSTTTPYTVTPAGSATVEQEGNEFTVTPTANCTIQINFEAIPSHDIFWYANGQQVAKNNQQEGDDLIIPADPDPATYCDGKAFVGWTATSSVAPDGTGITYVKAGDKVGATDKYYAVWAKGEGSGDVKYTKVTAKADLTDGVYLISSGSYVYAGQNGSNNYGKSVNASASNDIYSSLPNEAKEITLKWNNTTTAYSLYDGTSYLCLTESDNKLMFSDEEKVEWCLPSNYVEPLHTTYNTRYIKLNTNDHRVACYSSSGSYMYFYKKSGGITYTDYTTSCCTKLAAPATLSATATGISTATLNWTGVTNNNGYQYKVDEGEWQNVDKDATSATISGLSKGQHTIYLRAKGTGDYCDFGEEKSTTVTTYYTVSAGSCENGSVKVSLDNSNWSTSVDAAAGTTVYLQATPASVTYVFSSWNAPTSGSISDNQLTDWTGDVTITAKFILASIPTLDTPDGMSATPGLTSTTLSWNEVEGAVGYTVVFNNVQYAGITSTSKEITGLTSGTEYIWTVQAIGDGETHKTGVRCDDQHFTTTQKDLTGIDWTPPTKLIYNKGEKMDITGMVVTATYNDGTQENVTDDCTLTIADKEEFTEAGKKQFRATYKYTGTEEVTKYKYKELTINAKINWVVNGTPIDPTFASNGKVVLPATDPTSWPCIDDYPFFVGWTSETITGETATEPSYISAGIDAVDEATYYAVFAAGTKGAGFKLVTALNQVQAVDKVMITNSGAAGSAYAIGKQTDNHNRKAVPITIDDQLSFSPTIATANTDDTNPFVFTLGTAMVNEMSCYTFYDEVNSGYLYAAGRKKDQDGKDNPKSNSNHLKVQTDLDDNGKWKISIDATSYTMSAVAQGSNKCNIMCKNSSNEIFAAYGTPQSQGDVYLYKQDPDNYTAWITSCPQRFTITCATGLIGGEVSVQDVKADYAVGSTITLNANPISTTGAGYQLQAWNVYYMDGDNKTTLNVDANNQFKMPSFHVNVSAEFEKMPASEIKLDITSKQIPQDQEFTLTATIDPETAYIENFEWVISGAGLSQVETNTISGNTVTATFVGASVLPDGSIKAKMGSIESTPCTINIQSSETWEETDIVIATQPTTKAFNEGDNLDIAGLVVNKVETSNYSHQRQTPITDYTVWIGETQVTDQAPYTFTHEDAVVGTKTVTIKYSTFSKTYDVTLTPKKTVTFYVRGTGTPITETEAKAGVVVPTNPDKVGDYEFYGWSTTNPEEETQTAPTKATITEGKYHPTTIADDKLYAIYTTSKEGRVYGFYLTAVVDEKGTKKTIGYYSENSLYPTTDAKPDKKPFWFIDGKYLVTYGSGAYPTYYYDEANGAKITATAGTSTKPIPDDAKTRFWTEVDNGDGTFTYKYTAARILAWSNGSYFRAYGPSDYPYNKFTKTKADEYISSNVDWYTSRPSTAVTPTLDWPQALTTTVQALSTVQNVAITNSSATITYESDNTEVATVDEDGTVHGKKYGEANITAKVAAVPDEFFAAEISYKISVTRIPTVINFVENEQTITKKTVYAGNEYQLAVQTNSDAIVNYDLSSTYYASIATDGKLTVAAATGNLWNSPKYVTAYAKQDQTDVYERANSNNTGYKYATLSVTINDNRKEQKNMTFGDNADKEFNSNSGEQTFTQTVKDNVTAVTYAVKEGSTDGLVSAIDAATGKVTVNTDIAGDAIIVATAVQEERTEDGIKYIYLAKTVEYAIHVNYLRPIITYDGPALVGGKMRAPQTVTLTAQEGDLITYTLDGSTPDEDSERYTEPFEVSESMTIKAIAISNDLTQISLPAELTLTKDIPTTKVLVNDVETAETNLTLNAGDVVTIKAPACLFKYEVTDAYDRVIESRGSAEATTNITFSQGGTYTLTAQPRWNITGNVGFVGSTTELTINVKGAAHLPLSYTGNGTGVKDLPYASTSQDLGNYDNAVNTKIQFKPFNGDVWMTINFLEDPKYLSFYAKHNKGTVTWEDAQNVLKVEQSADNANWTTIATFDKNNAITTSEVQYEFDTQLKEGTRYIRWTYHQGSSGANLGLGNIVVKGDAYVVYQPATVLPEDYQGDVIVKDGGELLLQNEETYILGGDLTIEEGGVAKMSGVEVFVNNLYIKTSLGDLDHAAASSQIVDADNLLAVSADAYFDVKLDPSGVAEYGYYAFAVPFEVNLRDGVYGYTGGAWQKLTLEYDYAILDYQGDVRAQGEYGWIKTAKHASVLQPGVFYIVTVADTDFGTLRFKKTAGSVLNNSTTEMSLSAFASGVATDAGWNGIANPNMTYSNVTQADGNKAQVYYHSTNTFDVLDLSSTSFVVASPFFVQAGEDGDYIELTTATNEALRAPSRTTMGNDEFNVRLGQNTNSYVDQIYLSATDDATANYQIGHDMVKNYMGEPKVAQMYINGYGQKLCDAEFQLNGDEARFPLTITAPTKGEYQLYVNSIMTGATLYLYQNDNLIWNLSQGAYEMDLAKGTNNEYTLVMKVDKSDVITGSDVINTQADGIQKFIYDEKLILIHNGNVYNGAGARMK